MTLADNRPVGIDNLAINNDPDALLHCERASELIFVGQFEGARESLGTLWQGVGVRPPLEAFSPSVAAEVLLQCGALSGYVGSSQHLGGAQEAAKDLLSEGIAGKPPKPVTNSASATGDWALWTKLRSYSRKR